MVAHALCPKTSSERLGLFQDSEAGDGHNRHISTADRDNRVVVDNANLPIFSLEGGG